MSSEGDILGFEGYIHVVNKRRFSTFPMCIVIVFCFLPVQLYAQTTAVPDKPERSAISLSLIPGVEIPFGSRAETYAVGGAIDVSIKYRFPAVPLLSVGGTVTYSLNPLKTGQMLSIAALSGDVSAQFQLGKRFLIAGFANVGPGIGILVREIDTVVAPGLCFGGGAALRFDISPAISIGLDAGYSGFLGVYDGLSVHLCASYSLPKREEASSRPLESVVIESGENEGVQFKSISTDTVFPVFHKYYDDKPIGTAELYNIESKPATDIKLSLLINRYMEMPKEMIIEDEIEPGETKRIDLYALFSEDILEINEGTKVPAEFTLEYRIEGQRYRKERIETVRVYNRNAMTWDDDRRAAAFVTAKDPAVMRIAKKIGGAVRSLGTSEVSMNLRIGMGLYETICLYGMDYVIDPSTPYTEYSENPMAVDFLQFPRQTLEFGAGDCDDLSILYCSLFEAIGIETAFITVPGHIFMAFALEMAPEQVRNRFSRTDELIFRNDKAWVPVETTRLDGSFQTAWQTAAKSWREANSRDQAGFFPVHEAWQTFEPVGLPGDASIALPSEETILEHYVAEHAAYVEREIFPQVEELESAITQWQNNERYVKRYINKLGILYARYGLTDIAVTQFERLLVISPDYVPAIINIGNLHYLKPDMESALQYYEQAYEIDPANPQAVLNMARCNHELENYGSVKKLYEQLSQLDRELAEQFSYLDLRGEEAARAAAAGGAGEIIVWDEEEDSGGEF